MSKGPRALFLAQQLGPGGVTMHMKTLAQGLIANGWEVALASRGLFGKHSHGPEWFEAQGVKHFYLPFPLPYLSFENAACFGRSLLRLDSVVRQFRPDIIHVHWRTTSLFARVIQSVRKIPFVSSLHIDQTPSGYLHRTLSFWGERAIAISRETRDDLINRFGVPSEKVQIIYYGFDEAYFRPPSEAERAEAREELGVPQGANVISLIGSDYRRKGHDVLIRALGKLRVEGIEATVLLAGESQEAGAIGQLAAEAGVADLVRLLGYTDARKVLWASDFLALPSRREGLPMVVIEAMLCGVVPVRTPAGGAFDQIDDGVNGFIVPFEDHTELALRLKELLSDSSLRVRMSEKALATARQKFKAHKMVEDTITVYEDVLKKHAALVH